MIFHRPATRSILALPALLTLAGGLAACRTESQTSLPPASKSWNLPVIEAGADPGLAQVVVGSVVSEARIELASRLGGRIAEMRVQEGDAVRRGQLLVRLDAAEVEGGIRQARSGVAAAEAAARDAAADLERWQALADRGSASNNELRKVQLRHESAREALNQARAGLDTAAAQRRQAGLESPIDGVVVARGRRAGDLALPGQPLLTLEAIGPLHFELQLPESQLAQVRPGQAVEVRVDGQVQALKGTVSRVLPSSDAVARRHTVKIALPAAKGLASGQFGRVSLASAERGGLVLPRSALVERGGLSGVFVVDADNRARFRWLRTGQEWSDGRSVAGADRGAGRAADRIEVTAGLQPHERLLARVEPGLREGDLIDTTAASVASKP